MSLRHALKWSFLSELAAKAIQPVVFVVCARLLTPEDFGVLSAALMVVSFAQIIWDAGFSKALIQRQSDVEAATNSAFWMNVALGAVIAALLILTAGPIARTFFHDDRVVAVLRVMTLQVFLGSVSAVHTAILQKNLGFERLFWVRFATVSLPGLASIPLAWLGFNYWALVAGTLIGQTAQTVMLWRMSSWRPRWTFDPRVASELGRFGAWVGVSGLLTWFYAWADSLVVGVYFGSRELGLYRTGSQFAAMVFFILFGPVVPVLYSHLSRMKGDRERLRAALQRVIKMLAIVAIPVAVIVFVSANELSTVLFGPKWKGIGLIIGVMALMQAAGWVVGMNGEFYRAMGKPFLETGILAGSLVLYLAGYVYSIRFGLETFVWTRFLLSLVPLLVHFIVIGNVLKVPPLPNLLYLLLIACFAAVPAFIVSRGIDGHITSIWLRIAVDFTVIGAVSAGLIYHLERFGVIRDFARILLDRDGMAGSAER